MTQPEFQPEFQPRFPFPVQSAPAPEAAPRHLLLGSRLQGQQLLPEHFATGLGVGGTFATPGGDQVVTGVAAMPAASLRALCAQVIARLTARPGSGMIEITDGQVAALLVEQGAAIEPLGGVRVESGRTARYVQFLRFCKEGAPGLMSLTVPDTGGVHADVIEFDRRLGPRDFRGQPQAAQRKMLRDRLYSIGLTPSDDPLMLALFFSAEPLLGALFDPTLLSCPDVAARSAGAQVPELRYAPDELYFGTEDGHELWVVPAQGSSHGTLVRRLPQAHLSTELSVMDLIQRPQLLRTTPFGALYARAARAAHSREA